MELTYTSNVCIRFKTQNVASRRNVCQEAPGGYRNKLDSCRVYRPPLLSDHWYLTAWVWHYLHRGRTAVTPPERTRQLLFQHGSTFWAESINASTMIRREVAHELNTFCVCKGATCFLPCSSRLCPEESYDVTLTFQFADRVEPTFLSPWLYHCRVRGKKRKLCTMWSRKLCSSDRVFA